MLRINLLILLFTGLTAYAQRKGPTQQQAENAFRNPTIIDRFSFPEGSAMFDVLSKKDVGEIIIEGKDIYKIISHEDIVMYRYGCLYLNSELYSPEEINAKKEAIISAYKSGTPFEVLIDQYYPGKGKEQANLKCARGGLSITIVKKLDISNPGDIFVDDYEKSIYIIVKNTEPYYLKAVEALHIIYIR